MLLKGYPHFSTIFPRELRHLSLYKVEISDTACLNEVQRLSNLQKF